VSSTSTRDAGTPPKRKNKNKPRKQQDTRSTPSSSEQSQPPVSKEVAAMQRKLEDFQNKTDDMASVMREMLGQLKEVKQSLSQQGTPIYSFCLLACLGKIHY
jgi:hypothetical protein